MAAPGRTAAERRLTWLLRLLAALFATGTVGFLLRPDALVADLDRVGRFVGLATLPPSAGAVAADFWFALAIANMATITVCSWLAAGDVRGRRAMIWPVVVSKFTSSATAAILFVQWAHAFPFVVIILVDLPIGVLLLSAARKARLEP